jgi:hypothetical protein
MFAGIFGTCLHFATIRASAQSNMLFFGLIIPTAMSNKFLEGSAFSGPFLADLK